MNDVEAAKGSSRKRQQPIDVAIIYNVDFEEARTEADPCFESRSTVESVAEEVASALASDGVHNVTLVPTEGDFAELRSRLEAISPMCVFNMCESLGSDARLETAVPTVLELMGIPYTGSPPEALSAALYKDRVKQRLVQAGVPTPRAFSSKEETSPAIYRFPSSSSRLKKTARQASGASRWCTTRPRCASASPSSSTCSRRPASSSNTSRDASSTSLSSDTLKRASFRCRDRFFEPTQRSTPHRLL